jgi:hypothetical protein
MSSLSRSRLLNTETPVPNVPAHEKYDDSPGLKSLPGRLSP